MDPAPRRDRRDPPLHTDRKPRSKTPVADHTGHPRQPRERSRLDTRTDLSVLAEHYPELARRFTALRDEFDNAHDDLGRAVVVPAGSDGGGGDDRARAERRETERRRVTAEAFDQVIAEIRALPKFTAFLRPLPVRELTVAAAGGPVVMVTVSRFGSHALILTGSGVLEPLLLPSLTHGAVTEHVVALMTALHDMSRQDGDGDGGGRAAAAERQLAGTLGWLWDVLAGPVLDRLGFTGPPKDGEPWPRLWWCPSGLLSFLPLHAAGHHDTRHNLTPATVIDRVVSSYTPTIRALAHARRLADNGGGGSTAGITSDRIVVVAMPHTPGAKDLPGTEAEAALLRRRFPSQVSVLAGPQATYETVLAALSGARWAHFACHGYSDVTNPSASRLLLADHRHRPLTVVDVARLRMDDAELAFLSACETAQPGARLADEAIHLASAFQLAGYRHVVGTLWPIIDRHAVRVADDVYTAITSGVGSQTGDVAGAVHAATRRLREIWPDDPSVWASHVHSGP